MMCMLVQQADGCRKVVVPELDGVGQHASVCTSCLMVAQLHREGGID